MSLINSVGSTSYLNSNGRVGVSQELTIPPPENTDYSTRVNISQEAYALNAGVNSEIAPPNVENPSVQNERAIEGQRQALNVVRDFEQEATLQNRLQTEQIDFATTENQAVETQRNEEVLDEVAREERTEAQRVLEDAQNEAQTVANEFESTNSAQAQLQTSNAQESAANSYQQQAADESQNRAPQEGYSGTNSQASLDFIV